ncbi:hypothetical protein Bca4012_026514 [Brassica carinata]
MCIGDKERGEENGWCAWVMKREERSRDDEESGDENLCEVPTLRVAMRLSPSLSCLHNSPLMVAETHEFIKKCVEF